MSPTEIAQRINGHFGHGADFAGLFYGWVGCPWRPNDTWVSFKRCWAEGDTLCIETTQPYGDLATSMHVRIRSPAGRVEVGARVLIERAEWIELDGTRRSEPPGGTVAFATYWVE